MPKNNKMCLNGLSRWLSGKESACQDTGDTDLIPGSGRSPGGGNGNPLQYSRLENPLDRGALAGYSPWGHKESGRVERLILSLSIPEGKTHPKASLAHFTA